ncbi:MAG: efflux RND transporter permease subunit, partial [Gammaproteobacteria bacterium]|nr:efflux RND transporter permease subunit [Gammaproteobacteria bacterium]
MFTGLVAGDAHQQHRPPTSRPDAPDHPTVPLTLITVFARHRVACNLLMTLMLLAGLWALDKLNRQFFPNFELDFVTVGVTWTGASPEDVESAVTNVLEEELRTVDGLRKLTSESYEGRARLILEYDEGTDMGSAVDQVKERVALIRNLPADAEEPEISKVVRYEPVARLIVHGPDDLERLRPLARQIEEELLRRGIAQVRFVGLPEEEIAVQVSAAMMHELSLSLDDIANRIAARSRDIPAGNIGRDDVTRQLRALDQQRREVDFEQLPIISDANGRLLRLGDIASIERRPKQGQAELLYKGRPAIELRLNRTETSDSLEAAQALQDWLREDRPKLPRGIEVRVYDETWQLIWERIELLLRNGGSGLLLVLLVLFAFLNARVAFWVAVGIPVSFMACLGVLYLVGGTINMISLFALIMALGIIVDDAIVVGEDALAHFQQGDTPLQAAELGAQRMLAPVVSSSLTTIAAFLPLMLVGGIIGNILFDIP